MEKEIDKQLRQFLQIAKKKTFASRIFLPKRLEDGGREYIYRSGSFEYRDKYYGSNLDTGQELVFLNNELIWSMSYRGGMLDGHEDKARKCFSFLKKCLRNAPIEFPVRGQRESIEKNFRYTNEWTGDIHNFTGNEKIYLDGVQIYFRNYLGGSGKKQGKYD